MVVPLLPASSAAAGAERPCSPRPRMVTVSPAVPTSTPSARRHARVLWQSRLAAKRPITDVPSAIAASMA